ncbi:MAG TPA: DUF2891 domain-containing protein [Flavobacteriaceae bacterium]|nr:DUF2891 domain-containing protein [Flavobacteriaceae bacterium]
MKKTISIFIVSLSLICCKGEPEKETTETGSKPDDSTGIVAEISEAVAAEPVVLTLQQANKLAQLPLNCINTEYPNKLDQVIGSAEDLAEPNELHPAFYGCFDWHSAVHAHWSLVSLLKQFPDLEQEEKIREILKTSLSKENIQGEIAYFKKELNKTYERTYGWAWLLKLATALHQWDDPLAQELEANLQPLTDLIVKKFNTFLPKLVYPIRVGEHQNTAFALALAYDYAKLVENEDFLELIEKTATDFYLEDDNCPLAWEPSGFDFLSPCLSEIDIMRRVLSENAFKLWMQDFMPQLKNEDFSLEVGKVSDRSDGKLVHLDGLNFSRAWVLSGLANQYPEEYSHLKETAQKHIQHSLPNLIGDTYEGGHWLGSFAIYALNSANAQP